MSNKQMASSLYYAIEDLGEIFMVMYQSEYDMFLDIFEWYLNKHPLEDDNPAIIRLYSALLKYSHSGKCLELTTNGNDVLVRQILREYIDEH